MPTIRRISGSEDAPEPVEEQLELPVDVASKPKRQGSRRQKNGNGANLGFEATLWAAADKLRNNMDAAEYKHVVLGLIFLKYISDAFEEKYQTLLAEQDQGADPEDPEEYQGDNIFWMPKEARWSQIKDHAKNPEIGKKIDEAMIAIGKHNPVLKRAPT
jgi:type I restriction enzyme M protein